MPTFGKIGRYLFAIPFGVFGIIHFLNGPMMAEMVPVAGGLAWIYLTGTAMIAAAVGITTGKFGKLAAALLGVLLLTFTFAVELPAFLGGDMNALSQILKGTSLAGGAWVVGAYLAILPRDDVAE